MHPDASLSHVSDETILDWRETTTCEVMTSLDFRVAYHILYSKGQDNSGVVDVDDELLRMIDSNCFHHTGLQARMATAISSLHRTNQ